MEAPVMRTMINNAHSWSNKRSLPSAESKKASSTVQNDGTGDAEGSRACIHNAEAKSSSLEQQGNPLEAVLESLGREGGLVKRQDPSTSAATLPIRHAAPSTSSDDPASASVPHPVGTRVEGYQERSRGVIQRSSFSAILGHGGLGGDRDKSEIQHCGFAVASNHDSHQEPGLVGSCQESSDAIAVGKSSSEQDEVLLWLRNPNLGSAFIEQKQQLLQDVSLGLQKASVDSKAGLSNPGPLRPEPQDVHRMEAISDRQVVDDVQQEYASVRISDREQKQKQQQQLRDPKAFMAQLKSELPASLMTSVGSLLTQYRYLHLPALSSSRKGKSLCSLTVCGPVRD
jgi:hypothetical protein